MTVCYSSLQSRSPTPNLAVGAGVVAAAALVGQQERHLPTRTVQEHSVVLYKGGLKECGGPIYYLFSQYSDLVTSQLHRRFFTLKWLLVLYCF